jgi:hypothetical protein
MRSVFSVINNASDYCACAKTHKGPKRRTGTCLNRRKSSNFCSGLSTFQGCGQSCANLGSRKEMGRCIDIRSSGSARP